MTCPWCVVRSVHPASITGPAPQLPHWRASGNSKLSSFFFCTTCQSTRVKRGNTRRASTHQWAPCARAARHLLYFADHRQQRLPLHVLLKGLSRHVRRDVTVGEGVRRFAAALSVQRAEAPTAERGQPPLIPRRRCGLSLCGQTGQLAEVFHLVEEVLLEALVARSVVGGARDPEGRALVADAAAPSLRHVCSWGRTTSFWLRSRSSLSFGRARAARLPPAR